MGTYWEITLLRQPAIFERFYLGAQMEFEGVLWCKIILFFSYFALGATWSAYNNIIQEKSQMWIFFCTNFANADDTGTNFLSVHLSGPVRRKIAPKARKIAKWQRFGVIFDEFWGAQKHGLRPLKWTARLSGPESRFWNRDHLSGPVHLSGRWLYNFLHWKDFFL